MDEGEITPDTMTLPSSSGKCRIVRSFRRPHFRPGIDCLQRSSTGEVDDYKEIRHIGSGGYGNCFLLERKSDKALRVCKVQERESLYPEEKYEDTPLEVTILRDILPRHDHILHLQDFVLQPHTVQLYYDYYSGGDLHGLISQYIDQWQNFPETFLWHAYLQMSEALSFLHYGYNPRQTCPAPVDWTAVIHGDIKDRNIFLGPPDPNSSDPLAREYPSLVLGDFGMADLQASHRWSTPQWQPPELPVTSMKADVWGVGAVMHALAHEGRTPISALPPRELGLSWDEWCEHPNSRDPLPLQGLYSDQLHDCVFNALEFDPKARYPSYMLYSKVLGVWNCSIAPAVKTVIPLIPAAEDKQYDDNGVTLQSCSDELETRHYKTCPPQPIDSLRAYGKQPLRYSDEELKVLEEQAVPQAPQLPQPANNGRNSRLDYDSLMVDMFSHGKPQPTNSPFYEEVMFCDEQRYQSALTYMGVQYCCDPISV